MHHTLSVEIDRSAAEVFTYIADFENNPRWQGGMESCRWTSAPPVDVAGQPPWYQRLPGMGSMVRRSVDGDYARLKATLEASDAGSSE